MNAQKIWQFLEEDNSRWTQGAYARNKENISGYTVLSEASVCWCALGLAYKFYGEHSPNPLPLWKIKEKLSRAAGEPIIVWNDRPKRKVQEVIALFKAVDL